MTSDQNAPRKPSRRSKAGNGNTLFVDDVDGRTVVARRYKDILSAVIEDQGGADNVSEVTLHLARRFAGLAVQAEALEAALARGESISLADHSQLASTLTRLATRLGVGRKAREIVPTIEGYVAAKREAGK